MQNDFEYDDAIRAIEVCRSNGLTGTALAFRNILDELLRENSVAKEAHVSSHQEAQKSD